jgi:putative ABC transport system substrate-binding protein
MREKFTGLALGAMLFALGASAQGQQPAKTFRIGFLDRGTAASAAHLDSFRHELSKLGWIEHKNLVVEYRFAEGKTERLPELAAELVRLKVDLIVATGAEPMFAAKSATTSIAIVMTGFPDPVGEGLVTSLARPGGNITGFSSLTSELNSKRLEILKDAVPKLARVGVLRQGGTPVRGDIRLNDLRAGAALLKLKLELIETRVDAKSLENAFKIAKQKQVKAIVVGGGRLFFAERKRIVEFAVQHRLPAIYPQSEFVDDGGLMSYGTDSADLYRGSAHYVDKILKGTKPADLPVQQATKFEFIINLKAAKQIGLTIPVRVLERANQVIK